MTRFSAPRYYHNKIQSWVLIHKHLAQSPSRVRKLLNHQYLAVKQIVHYTVYSTIINTTPKYESLCLNMSTPVDVIFLLNIANI